MASATQKRSDRRHRTQSSSKKPTATIRTKTPKRPDRFLAVSQANAETVIASLDLESHSPAHVLVLERDARLRETFLDALREIGLEFPCIDFLALPDADAQSVSGLMERAPFALLERDLDGLTLESQYALMLVAPPQDRASHVIEALFPKLEPGGRMVLALSKTCQATPGAKAILERYQVSLTPLEPHGDEEFFCLVLERPYPIAEAVAIPDAPVEPFDVSTERQLLEVNLEDIFEDEAHNPRRTLSDPGLEDLAASIQAIGLRQPLELRPREAGGYWVVAGHRRRRAIQRLHERGGWPAGKPILAFVSQANDSSARLIALSENEQREAVDPLEQAEGYAKLRESGHSVADIAVLAGKQSRFVEQRLRLAHGLCPRAKALYREGQLTLEALEALTVASLEAQDRHLREADGWGLSARGIREAFRKGTVTMQHAKFTLEDYLEAGGTVQHDLFSGEADTVLEDVPLALRLQRTWLETEKQRLLESGWAWVEVAEEPVYISPLNRNGTIGDGSGVIISLDPRSLEITVIEGVRKQDSTATETPSSSRIQQTPARPEYTKSFVRTARQLRSYALQQGLLESGNRKLGLVVVLLGLLGVSRVHVKRGSSVMPNMTGYDKIAKPVTEALEAAAKKLELPSTHASSADWHAETLLENLLALGQDELLDLLLTVAATSIRDWVSSEKDETLIANGLIARVAVELGVRGHERWKLEEEYLRLVGHRKEKLLAYLGAVGINQPGVFTDLPAKNLRKAILERRDKLDQKWCPPELEIVANAEDRAGTSEVDVAIDPNTMHQGEIPVAA